MLKTVLMSVCFLLIGMTFWVDYILVKRQVAISIRHRVGKTMAFVIGLLILTQAILLFTPLNE